jgi:hypothetical protein
MPHANARSQSAPLLAICRGDHNYRSTPLHELFAWGSQLKSPTTKTRETTCWRATWRGEREPSSWGQHLEKGGVPWGRDEPQEGMHDLEDGTCKGVVATSLDAENMARWGDLEEGEVLENSEPGPDLCPHSGPFGAK